MKKLNGYRPTHRNKWYFLQNKILSLQELALLEFYADLFDFGITHQGFGTFKTNFKEFKQIFNCKSENTIRNWHNKLLKLGLIKKTADKNIYKLTCPERYIGPGKWQGKAARYQEIEKDQPIETILQSFGINLQSVGEKAQNVEIETQENTDATNQSTPIAIDSSKEVVKVNSKVVVIEQGTRSDEEYEKIYKEGGYKNSAPEDMKWIDENVKEKIPIDSEEQEKEIVEIYFDGNWDEYRKHLITN